MGITYKVKKQLYDIRFLFHSLCGTSMCSQIVDIFPFTLIKYFLFVFSFSLLFSSLWLKDASRIVAIHLIVQFFCFWYHLTTLNNSNNKSILLFNHFYTKTSMFILIKKTIFYSTLCSTNHDILYSLIFSYNITIV